MKKSTLILCLILLGCTICHAATVSGFVSREDSGEPIQYVNVRLVDTGAGMQTNKKGYYVINLPGTGTYTLEATLISFETRKFSFTITKAEEDKSLNIKMKEAAIEMATVRVTGSSADEGREIRPSLIRRTTEDVKSVVSPIEADVFRAVLTLPGVAPVCAGRFTGSKPDPPG